MFRSIGRGVIELARAIDTGNAIRHGVQPRAPRGHASATSSAPSPRQPEQPAARP